MINPPATKFFHCLSQKPTKCADLTFAYNSYLYLRNISAFTTTNTSPPLPLFHEATLASPAQSHSILSFTNRKNGDCSTIPQPRRPPLTLALPRFQRRRTWPLARDTRRTGFLHAARDANHTRKRLERASVYGGNWRVSSHVSSTTSSHPSHTARA